MAKQRGQAATKIQASIRRKQAAKAAEERKQAVVAEQNLLLNRKASQIQKLARGRLGKKKVCGLACFLPLCDFRSPEKDFCRVVAAAAAVECAQLAVDRKLELKTPNSLQTSVRTRMLMLLC